MNKFETSRRVISAALLFNMGALLMHSQEASAAPKMKCTTVSPQYEEIIAQRGILILPENNGNMQRYQITEGRTPGVADISQVELHQNKIEATKALNLTKATKGHDVSVSFKDAGDVTMEFRSVYYQPAIPGGAARAVLEPLICKPLEIVAA